jgi:hypothetical protein
MPDEPSCNEWQGIGMVLLVLIVVLSGHTAKRRGKARPKEAREAGENLAKGAEDGSASMDLPNDLLAGLLLLRRASGGGWAPRARALAKGRDRQPDHCWNSW